MLIFGQWNTCCIIIVMLYLGRVGRCNALKTWAATSMSVSVVVGVCLSLSVDCEPALQDTLLAEQRVCDYWCQWQRQSVSGEAVGVMPHLQHGMRPL